jgi:LPS-assembly lipoprotein
MWSSRRFARMRPAAVAAAAMLVLSACTAQPLYSGSVAPQVDAGIPGQRIAAATAQIRVAEVTTREAQQVRNELIFLLAGGRGNPAEAPYSLALSAYSFSESSALATIAGTEQAPTSAIMSFIGAYTLTETASGRVLGSGTRRATASYDVPGQPFAAQRAIRDAQDRSARELAAFLSSAIAADLAHGRYPAESVRQQEAARVAAAKREAERLAKEAEEDARKAARRG